MSEPATISLFEQLGVDPAIDAAVEKFYQKVLADKRVSHWFEGTDMTLQLASQKKFLAMVFGGPNSYTGMALRVVHSPLVANGLGDDGFDAVVEILGDTLKEMGVADNLIAQVAAIAESTRKPVFGTILNNSPTGPLDRPWGTRHITWLFVPRDNFELCSPCTSEPFDFEAMPKDPGTCSTSMVACNSDQIMIDFTRMARI